MKRLSRFLLLSLLWPGLSLAVANTDTAFNKDTSRATRTGYEMYGGNVTDVGIDDQGRMYASTFSPNGIFHSTNQGQVWHGPVAGSDMGKVIALEISDEPDTVYILGGVSLYKTTDGGTNWTELAGASGSTEGNDYNTSLAYANGILIAPERTGVVDISLDEGETFTSASLTGLGDVSSAVGNSTGSIFYLLGSADSSLSTRTLYSLDPLTGDFITSSQSGNYSQVNVKPGDDNFIVIAGVDGALYTTTGMAGTWQTLTSTSTNGAINFDGDRIYIGSSYTDDNGATWTTSAYNIEHMVNDPNDNSVALIGSGTGTSVSADGGETFSSATTGMLAVTVNDIVQSTNKQSVWLAAQGGLAHTSDFLSDTPTWEYPILPDQASTSLDAVWVDPETKQHVVAGGAALYYTANEGDTWTPASGIDLTPGTYTDIVSDGDILYASFFAQAGDDGTVYSSTDGGATWTDMGGVDVPVNALAILNNGNIVAAVGYEFNSDTDQRGIFKYDGSSWSQLDIATDQAMTSIVVKGEKIYAAGIGTPGGKVVRSTDNGDSWDNLTSNGLPDDGYFQSLAVQAGTDNVYVATGSPSSTGYVYKSTDGGDTWSKLYTGLVDEQFNVMLFDGLVTGTTVGLEALQSKARVRVSKDQNELTATLSDVATGTRLNRHKLRLFVKRNGTWHRIKADEILRTDSHGQVTVSVHPSTDRYYQIRWLPTSDNDTATYGTSAFRSSRIQVKAQV